MDVNTLCSKSKSSVYYKFLMTAVVYVSIEFVIMWDYRNKLVFGQKDGGIGNPTTHSRTETLT